MNDFNPFPCATKVQRDKSLESITHLHTRTVMLLAAVHANQTILVNPEFEEYLMWLACEYEKEIHRLKSVKFTRQGVVEI